MIKARLERFIVVPSNSGSILARGCVDIEMRVLIDGTIFCEERKGVPLDYLHGVLRNIKGDLARTYTASVALQIGELI